MTAFLAWLGSPAYLLHVDACARWAAEGAFVGHVGSYG